MTGRNESWLNRRLEIDSSLQYVPNMALSEEDILKICDGLDSTTARPIEQDEVTALSVLNSEKEYSSYAENSNEKEQENERSIRELPYQQDTELVAQFHELTLQETPKPNEEIEGETLETQLEAHEDQHPLAKVSQYQQEDLREYSPMHDAYHWKLMNYQHLVDEPPAPQAKVESVYLF
ncbi:unnamed protein product [Bursaphelenchus okinawaensis]|uniref:Uncharacterized protein n=1 Tax=Bursaphelenchus okinawaensis TaxID=465554 RepID=A0A811L793_9BILA|nr:unnamed protein product [Bursaphelenchus okinawaensis]CAG9117767.1 unnamed protein product [Bursaphelenchus okinawaensis]